MELHAIYTKTPRGVSEVRNRAARLSRSLLTVLTMIDGKSTVGQLLHGSKLPEMKFREAIHELEEEGFIKIAATGSEIRGDAIPARPGTRIPAIGSAGLDELDFTSITRTVLAERTGASIESPARATRWPFPVQSGIGDHVGDSAEEVRARSDSEARRVSEELARAKEAAEARARSEAEARARAEAQAKAEFEARARMSAEAEARTKAEARARLEAHIKVEAEKKARTEAERRAEEERHARETLEARIESERKAREEAERKARAEAELRAKEEAEARVAAARKARETEERLAREEAERKAAEALLALERQAREEAEQRARAEAQRIAREEIEAKLAAERMAREELETKLAAERKAKQDAETKAREEAEQRAKEEAERRTREETERRAREETDRKAREEFEKTLAAERKAKEEAERKALEEAERHAREEAETKARMETERKAREEAERRAEEEAERRTLEEAERRTREEVERKAREELETKLAAERSAKEEAERKAQAEAERHAREEAESRAREASERRAREEAEQSARLEAERRTKEEAERKAQEEAERLARAAAEQQAIEEAERQAKEAAERSARAEAEAKALADAAAEQEEAARSAATEARHAAVEETALLVSDETLREEQEQQLEARRPLPETGYGKSDIATQATVLAAPIIDLPGDAPSQSVPVAPEDEPQPIHTAPPEAGLGDVGSLFVIDLEALAEQERQLREEEEQKLKLEAERHAREIAAKEQAEAEAREQAELLQRESEEIARRTVEEAERRAQEEERRQQEEAERKAREDAARRAREEQERQIREEAERRDREDAEARARADAARRAEEKEAKRRAKEEEKARKQQEAEAKAQAKAEAKREGRVAKKRSRWTRSVALTASTLVLSALALIHVVPFNGYAPAMEEMARNTLGEPVKINSVRASLLPYPHFKLEGVTVGSEQDLKIAQVRAIPELASLFKPHKVLATLELQSVRADQEVLQRVPGWVTAEPGRPLQVRKVILTGINVPTLPAALPVFDGEVRLSESGALQKAEFRSQDGKLKVDLRGRPEGIEAEFSVRGWKPPLGPSIEFDEISGKADGRIGELKFSDISARLYGGSASGHARLTWNGPWNLAGEFSTRDLDLGGALKAFTSQFRATGRIDASGRYAMQSASLDRLFLEPRVEVAFKVERGELENVDLTRALQQAAAGTPVRGGKTQFAELSGTVNVSGKSFQYRQLALASGILLAHGSTELAPSGELAGRVNVELSAKPNPIRAVVAVSGKLADPQLKPSR